MSVVTNYLRFRSLLNSRLLQLHILQNTSKTFAINNIISNNYSGFRNKYNVNKCSSNLLSNKKVLINQQRDKSKSKKSREQEDSDDDEDEVQGDDDDDDYTKDHKEVTIHVTSTRVDAIVKAGFNISRTKAEKAVYEQLVRLNGEKIYKKGTKVNVGDEVDLIKGINEKNEDFLDISRLIIKDILLKSGLGKCLVIVHKYRTLTVENYKDKWKPSEDLL
ncbi:mitochondrial transcription rescue factor 1 isoform X2 [Centruroides vittatus]|uniref:mitochondrial transcription rescue factor 1 isoform X2 n=1 Tax=Centruroides vittatus TaxID=120091 RepID=UPI00350ED260